MDKQCNKLGNSLFLNYTMHRTIKIFFFINLKKNVIILINFAKISTLLHYRNIKVNNYFKR